MKNLMWLLSIGTVILIVACKQKKAATQTSDSTSKTTQDSTSGTAAAASTLTKVTSFKGQQVTGFTISKDGRMFANFPRWHKSVPNSVVEVLPDGSYKPYPNQTWNNWNGTPQPN